MLIKTARRSLKINIKTGNVEIMKSEEALKDEEFNIH